jgi:2-methylisocitrate lyase-like PEP mutase family enzyme
MADFTALRAAFRKLHESGCFVMPNPWDIGSALYLRQLGFRALASTSSGFAWTRGLADGAAPRDSVLGHLADLVRTTELPINADFEHGYAHDPDGVAQNVRLCVATGVAGLSIEDSTGDDARPLFDFSLAVERIKAAREAIGSSGVLLTARAECFLVKHPQALDESIRRLQAYSAAGADVLYAPGPQDPETIKALVAAVAPKPFNMLVFSKGLRVTDVAALGVRRISTGGALARSAWTGFAQAAKRIAESGDFSAFEHLMAGVELNDLFSPK